MNAQRSFSAVLIFFLLIASVCLNFSCSKAPASEPVKIGLITAITDKNNPSFQSDKDERIQAAKLAIDEINEAGGIYGRKLSLLIEDSRNDRVFAAQRARDLVKAGAAVIIGPTTSSQLEYVSDSVASKEVIVFISPSATSPDISQIKSDSGRFIWRTCPSDIFQANIAARYIYGDLKKSRLAIIYVDNSYGKSFSDILNRRFTAKKGTVTATISYPAEMEDNMGFDFSGHIDKLLKGNPEVVYIISATEAGKILKDMQKYVSDKKIQKPLIMGCDGNYDIRVLNNTDKAFAEGMTGTAPATSKDDPNFRKFAENYKEKYGNYPVSAWAASTYDAVYCAAYAMLKDGVQKTNNAQPAQLSRAVSANLVAISQNGNPVGVGEFRKGSDILKNGGEIDYEGASGDIDFDSNGDVTGGTYLIWQVKNGGFSELRTEKYP